MDSEMLDQHLRAYLDQSPCPITKIVNDPDLPRLVVLADPGSGKSTLLQYLLLAWAERAAPDPALDPLPLLIELREYAGCAARARPMAPSATSTAAQVWETLPMLKARARSDEDSDVRQSAIEELARGWKDDPETLSILKVRGTRPHRG